MARSTCSAAASSTATVTAAATPTAPPRHVRVRPGRHPDAFLQDRRFSPGAGGRIETLTFLMPHNGTRPRGAAARRAYLAARITRHRDDRAADRRRFLPRRRRASMKAPPYGERKARARRLIFVSSAGRSRHDGAMTWLRTLLAALSLTLLTARRPAAGAAARQPRRHRPRLCPAGARNGRARRGLCRRLLRAGRMARGGAGQSAHLAPARRRRRGAGGAAGSGPAPGGDARTPGAPARLPARPDPRAARPHPPCSRASG